MSEEQQELSQVSPGKILKLAREELNLTTQDIADRVRLKNSLIQDIEADNYDVEISLTFIKGYLKLYARQVRVREDIVIEAFDKLNTQKKEPAKLQSFSKRIATQAHDDKLMLVTYLIVTIVIALVVVWWFQQSSSSSITNLLPAAPVISSPEVTEESQDLGTDSLDSTESDVVEGSEQNVSEETEQDLIGTTEPVTNQPSQVEENDSNANDPLVTSIQLEPSQQDPLPGDIVEVAPVNLVFTFSTDCWMKLTDATGEDIAYGTKVQGRVMPVSGLPPFTVVLCSPEVVKIDYDGQPVDLSRLRVGYSANFTLPFTE